jgi:CRP/FNR family transcriptional regulator
MSLHAEPAVAAAIDKSVLRTLPAATVARLFEHAVFIDVPAGAMPQVQEQGTMVPGLVVSGLLRVFMTTPDGRQVTVRYAREGSLLAINTLYMKRTGPLSQQALTPVHTIRFWPDTLLGAAHRDPAVANLFAHEIATRLFQFLDELAGNTFGSMRQRVVRHLLDLAATDRSRGPLVAHVSQQALADAVGTVREVVVRALRELREEGLVRTGRDEIELLLPERLLCETYPR